MFIATTTAAVASAGTFPIFVYYVCVNRRVGLLPRGGRTLRALQMVQEAPLLEFAPHQAPPPSGNDCTSPCGPTGGSGPVKPASHSIAGYNVNVCTLNEGLGTLNKGLRLK